jgi:hypothetical protein
MLRLEKGAYGVQIVVCQQRFKLLVGVLQSRGKQGGHGDAPFLVGLYASSEQRGGVKK